MKFPRFEGPRWQVDELTGCWDWCLYLDNKGYGRWFYEGKNRQAYKVVFEMFKGSVPQGLVLDHLCRNHACVNPDHLEPVPTKINNRRGVRTKLTQKLVDDLRARFTGKYGQRKVLMLEFGIGSTQFHRIITQQQWI